MAIVGMIFYVIGAIIALVFGVILLIKAFKESVLWGLAYLFIPFASLVFVVKYWDECKDPFLKLLICIPFYIVGGVLVAMGS